MIKEQCQIGTVFKNQEQYLPEQEIFMRDLSHTLLPRAEKQVASKCMTKPSKQITYHFIQISDIQVVDPYVSQATDM